MNYLYWDFTICKLTDAPLKISKQGTLGFPCPFYKANHPTGQPSASLSQAPLAQSSIDLLPQ